MVCSSVAAIAGSSAAPVNDWRTTATRNLPGSRCNSSTYGRTSGGIAGAIELDGDTTGLTVTISSADGQVLKNVDLGTQKKGTVQFDWDGKTDAGADAGAGPFTVTASASKNNAAVTSRTLVWAPVASVAIPASGAAQLTVAGIGTIPVTAVREVG